MPQMHQSLRFVSLAIGSMLALVGCRFGEANFTSTIPSRGFEPGGTVFAYLDAHDRTLASDNDPRVVVVMTWVIFDPQSDLNDMEGSALEQMKHELLLRDAVSLVFDSQKSVRARAGFDAALLGVDQPQLGTLNAHVHFAPEHLTSESTYADIKPLAARRDVHVSVVNAFDDVERGVEGELSINLTAAASDPGSVQQGELKGSFKAPLVSERVAEQNLALLDIVDVLAVPLDARTP